MSGVISSVQLAQEVFEAWRDGMLRQGREVSPERKNWWTLSKQDQELDEYIAERVLKVVLELVSTNSPYGDW